MPKRQVAILRAARPTPPFWTVWLDAPHPPSPGAFVLAELGEPVRTPLFPAAIEAEGFAVMVPPGHPLTRLLPGTDVDLLGPFGRGFRLERATRLLLVAEAAWLPLLLPLLEAAPEVALVVEAPTRARLPAPERFPPAVELHLLTVDGSTGPAATLETVLPELVRWAERVLLACDPARYPALARLVQEVRLVPAVDFAQALIQVAMPCGVGACDVCYVETRYGDRHACTDGPVFDLLDLLPNS